MEFQDTGLPLDASLYRAFTFYRQNVKTIRPPHPEDFPVRIAQVLHKTVAAQDMTLLSTALLVALPLTTHGLVEQRFGGAVLDILKEASHQTMTSYATIARAGDRARMLTLAGAIISFENFKKAAAKMDRMLAEQEQGIEHPEGIRVIGLPDTSPYDLILKSCAGKNPNALEALYIEEYGDFKMFNKEHTKKLQALGVLPPDAQERPETRSGLDERTQTLVKGVPDRRHFRFPKFEDTGLLMDTVVLDAYTLVTKASGMEPENFEGALDVARLLSNGVADPNPAVIAAALIDIALAGLTEAELSDIKDRLDPKVVEILLAGSVYDIKTPTERLLQAPVEFRQLVLANAVNMVDTMIAGARDLEAFCAQNESSLSPDFFLQNLRPIATVYVDVKKNILPMFGTTDLPELEDRLEEKMREMQAFFETHVQKPSEPPRPGNKGGPRP